MAVSPIALRVTRAWSRRVEARADVPR